ncbi:MmgE/PrpD family protein [Telmatospirillum sp.]|uniref:MmgE/PrpD family protein n=1 Tax=Telmatospirillum sp. TaxID=2079197 RepID=UPI00284A39EE|nr:MmgE/PrpD family protein [Telmatospirillum sp.]MDR3438556.1 MmgE/PrpD family protein [Telmatospirillum sp.]
MIELNRRKFLCASALAGSALASGLPRSAQAAETAAASADDRRPAEDQASAKDVTRRLADYVVSAKPSDLPAPVRKEAARTLLNWIGCAVGGSRHETVDIAIGALAPFSGPAQASVLGRSEKLDVLHAALMNGISSHIFDFDDTHLKTVIHPAGPVASALLALSEYRPVSGRDFLNALVLGIEVECRIGNSVYPAHYDIGWHITGTTGVFGAAAAAGKLLGLDTRQMVWALGLASTQPVGLREMFGTMTKSFHPGRAAQNGLTAAFLAAGNYTSSEQGLEARRGWANVLSTTHNFREITEKLGETYEISLNTYKPFACGIVTHPTIDACIQLRNEHQLLADQIDRIELKVHPLVLELTGKKTPQRGLEGKFSIYHTAAIAIVEGAAGEPQFSDRAVRDPVVVGLRDRVVATIDPAIHEEQVRVIVAMKDGRRFEKYIEHALGSVLHPMSDEQLEGKFSSLAQGILTRDRIRTLMDLCWTIEDQEDAAVLARTATV